MKRKHPSASAIRKSRDIAVILPVVCIFLFMPPMIHLFTGSASLFGIPVVVMYMFGVWTAAIAVTFWNVQRLDESRTLEALAIEQQDPLP